MNSNVMNYKKKQIYSMNGCTRLITMLFGTILTLLPTLSWAKRGPFHCDDIVLESCLEYRPYKKADILRIPKGPGSFDEFEYKLIYREKTKRLHLILDKNGDKIEEKTYVSFRQLAKPFKTSELTGGIGELESQVKRFISEIEFNQCP